MPYYRSRRPTYHRKRPVYRRPSYKRFTRAPRRTFRRAMPMGAPTISHDAAITSTPYICTSTPVIGALTGYITEGFDTAQDTRLSKEILVASWEITMYMRRFSGADTATVDHTRVVLFRWKPDTALTGSPSVDDILEDTTTGPQMVLSPYIVDPVKRKNFTIMMDKRFTVGDYTSGVIPPETKPHRYKNTKHFKVLFNHDESGLWTGSGHLFMMFLGEYAEATANYTEIIYNQTVKYHSIL